MMTMAGNPVDYIFVFGGTSVEYIGNDDQADEGKMIEKIKKTLNDFWVFNVREKIWQPIYPNSLENPGPTEWG